MGKFYQCIQSYGPSFMTKFCSTLYLENLLTNLFAKLNLRGGVSCIPAALLFGNKFQSLIVQGKNEFLYISLSVAMTLICLLCQGLGGLVLKAIELSTIFSCTDL